MSKKLSRKEMRKLQEQKNKEEQIIKVDENEDIL